MEKRNEVMPRREITMHKVNLVNDKLQIYTLDGPGPGGANHEYVIESERRGTECRISFQNGPIGEVGVNGVTQEALIAVCIDRLECFQAGAFASEYNAKALTALKESLHWLLQRTRDRLDRGVEGFNKQ